MRLERKTVRIGRAICALTATMLALSTASTALAADKYVLEDVEETRVEFGTGWYIRGDLGVSFGRTNRTAAITAAGRTDIDDVSTVFGFRAGVGHQLSPNIRIDGTFDYHSRNDTESVGAAPGLCAAEQGILATDVNGAPIVDPSDPSRYLYTPSGVAPATPVPCTIRDSNEYDAQDLLLNAYYDFAPRGHFTPYVGVGIGATRLNYSSRLGETVCTPGIDVRCSGGGFGEQVTYGGTVNEGTSYHLASALTLGVSYDISRNLALDASYQLTKTFEKPLMGASNGYEVMGVDSLRHAVRVGVRYDLW